MSRGSRGVMGAPVGRGRFQQGTSLSKGRQVGGRGILHVLGTAYGEEQSEDRWNQTAPCPKVRTGPQKVFVQGCANLCLRKNPSCQ